VFHQQALEVTDGQSADLSARARKAGIIVGST
jgi:hypothetical protein